MTATTAAEAPASSDAEITTAQLTEQALRRELVAAAEAEGASAIAEAFVATPFSDDPRHQRRIDMVAAYERTGEAPPIPAAQGTRSDG